MMLPAGSMLNLQSGQKNWNILKLALNKTSQDIANQVIDQLPKIVMLKISFIHSMSAAVAVVLFHSLSHC